MAKTIVCILFLLGALLAKCVYATLIPPHLENAVVALGSMRPVEHPGQPCRLQWATEGTGFLYGYLVKDDPDPKKRQYEIYVVTNRHVIEDHVRDQLSERINWQPSRFRGECASAQTDPTTIMVRINPVSSSAEGRQFPLPVNKWFFHPNERTDIAAIRLNAQFLKEQGLMDVFFPNDVLAADKQKLKTIGVSAGDGVFVLGFPMNLAGIQRNYVIVRQGCIARITDMLQGVSPDFLLDTFIFPGNSGSPVILRPELTSITGTPAQANAYLIGIVSEYQTYTDLAISAQTRRPRITFEENSGLAVVLPVDFINEAIRLWKQSNPQAR
ncbi:MAG TPA: trypsin-like peptidase domain-containing protein [Terriglobia bacterium]|nr:trypsin-like peptidase domain-containing protein [Terriglobia bacterium]